MYSTCIFCKAPLGSNDVLEDLPVGRRVAFDAARGRLWVVCRKCERWNLSPIEERWEAIEAAERIFRETRMRVSTDQIGLARHREGLELVRIGTPQRPEFAAWRYGDQFGRRRKRALLVGGAAVGVIGTVAIAGVATGIVSGALLAQSGNFVNLWQNGRTLVRVRTEDGELLKLKRPDLQSARLRRDEEGDGFVLTLRKKKQQRFFRGAEAARIAGVMMPRVNATGARPAVVQQAVAELDSAGGPEAYMSNLLRNPPRRSHTRKQFLEPQAFQLGKLAVPSRLALEMALHEEQERRALEGELKALELAWQEAEEVAAIADDLLLPERVRRLIGRD